MPSKQQMYSKIFDPADIKGLIQESKKIMSEFRNDTFVVCVGRLFGAGGLTFAHRLQEVLGIPLYDKNILEQAAQDSNIRKELFERIDEVNNFSMPVAYGNIFSGPGSLFMYPENHFLSNENLFSVQAETIMALAQKGSGIFVGRCSDFILREHPHRISIFITEDRNIRMQRVKSRLSLSTDSEAMNMMEKLDKERREYYNYYTSERWGRAENYDISIKLSYFGIDYAVSMVIDLMKRRGFPLCRY